MVLTMMVKKIRNITFASQKSNFVTIILGNKYQKHMVKYVVMHALRKLGFLCVSGHITSDGCVKRCSEIPNVTSCPSCFFAISLDIRRMLHV